MRNTKTGRKVALNRKLSSQHTNFGFKKCSLTTDTILLLFQFSVCMCLASRKSNAKLNRTFVSTIQRQKERKIFSENQLRVKRFPPIFFFTILSFMHTILFNRTLEFFTGSKKRFSLAVHQC